jgi:Fe-S cluster biogenesis protein NfuA
MTKNKTTAKGMTEKIEESLASIRPSLQADGGDVKFKSFDQKTGIVKVELVGRCAHCPMSKMTLKEGVEAILKKEVPEVKEVING